MLQDIKLKPFTAEELEAMADARDESGHYHVKRRIKPWPRIEQRAQWINSTGQCSWPTSGTGNDVEGGAETRHRVAAPVGW